MCFIAEIGSIAGGRICVAGCVVLDAGYALQVAGYQLSVAGNNGIKFVLSFFPNNHSET